MTKLPPTSQEEQFEELLQDMSPEVERMAKEFKVFTRSRKIKNPQDLLRIVLLYCGLDQSLREVAANFTLLEERITDEAVRKRLTACGPWVKALLTKMLPTRNLDNLPDGLRFIVFDGSSIQAPAATGTDFRLHVGIDLVSLEFTHLIITDKHGGESLKHYPLNQGDVAIVDRGLCHANAILEKQSEYADVIARYSQSSMPLYHNDTSDFDLINWLKSNNNSKFQSHSVLAGAKNAEKVNGHIIALKLPEKEAKAARRGCRKQAASKARNKPSKNTLFLAGFLLVFTTLSPQILSPEILLEIYKCRWQIELAIKRLKSLLDLDELRAKEGSGLAEVWLNGKLLYALILEKRLRRKLGDDWGYLNKERIGSLWRPWKLLKSEIAPMITGVLFWRVENWCAALSVLFERSRHRKLQTIPESIRKLLPDYPGQPVPIFS